MVGEESEDEALEGEEDTKKSEYAGSTHNDNSISPPPPMQAITGAPPQAATGLTAPSIGGKKRHRSQDSEDVEEVNVSSPKKHNSSHRPLGLPGANIKIENRGTYTFFLKDSLFEFNDIWFTFDQVLGFSIEIYLFNYNSKVIKLCCSLFPS